ncbi:MAG TPA: hypothetical protein VMM55_03615, partial [Thermohalobaculum sp.]|nr:hypothetical protein [Thermohalobaculum sp.]
MTVVDRPASDSSDSARGLTPAGPAKRADVLVRADAFVFGPPPPERLSPRTRATIEENQRSSEVLVCLVQFAAIAFFGSVYALTPKAFPPSVPFEPVPVVLAVYAVFTGIRLWLAATGRLTRPFLIASIVVDVATLMITIWSFHLQYGMPPAIYLKSPTMLYVFILIALRAMRLEASFVVVTGVAAMVGWTVLVGYALADGAGMITRDWAGYMMSATILVGAEVDKLLAIGMVTAVLAVAVSRARRLMIAAAAERHAADELSRFFAPEVAGQIRDADIDLEAPGARREAAVLMVDLRGFSEMSMRLDPVETIALLSEYHA